MKRIKITDKNKKKALAEAVHVLQNGGIVIFPTETCYGVAANATHQKSVDKMLEYKRRPEGKAISIAVDSEQMAEQYVKVNDSARDVYAKFLPGPVTVISDSLGKVANGLEAENNTLGIRYPDYQLALDLIAELDNPISASSANSSGKKTPYTVEDILENISNKQKKLIDLVLDVGELEYNPPSTVIDTAKMNMQVIRKGSVKFQEPQIIKVINSPEEMQTLGEELINNYKNKLQDNTLLVLFNAELGAGKTQFTKGIAKGLGITENVTSPTYTLIEEYPYKNKKLVHFDAWRIEDPEELDSLRFEEYFLPGNVIVVEWAGSTLDYFQDVAKKYNTIFIEVDIEYKSLTTREVKIYFLKNA